MKHLLFARKPTLALSALLIGVALVRCSPIAPSVSKMELLRAANEAERLKRNKHDDRDTPTVERPLNFNAQFTRDSDDLAVIDLVNTSNLTLSGDSMIPLFKELKSTGVVVLSLDSEFDVVNIDAVFLLDKNVRGPKPHLASKLEGLKASLRRIEIKGETRNGVSYELTLDRAAHSAAFREQIEKVVLIFRKTPAETPSSS